MNTVFIRGLRAQAVIGVYEHERHIRQTLVLDLEMASDIARAAARDQLDDALDYAAVAACVRELVESSDFQLIETLADAVVNRVRGEFNVSWLRLTIHKPGAVPEADDVGVVVESGERP